jgi:hypothetical protein
MSDLYPNCDCELCSAPTRTKAEAIIQADAFMDGYTSELLPGSYLDPEPVFDEIKANLTRDPAYAWALLGHIAERCKLLKD